MNPFFKNGDIIYCQVNVENKNIAWYQDDDFKIDRSTIFKYHGRTYLRGEVSCVLQENANENDYLQITVRTGLSPEIIYIDPTVIDYPYEQNGITPVHEVVSEKEWIHRIDAEFKRKALKFFVGFGIAALIALCASALLWHISISQKAFPINPVYLSMATIGFLGLLISDIVAITEWRKVRNRK